MKLPLLKKIYFGSSIAEDEKDQLIRYFTETQLWQDLIDDKVDLILGDKGTGKSALFLLLQNESYNLQLRDRVHMRAAENPRGAAAFSSLVAEPPQPQKEVELLWKTYFLVISTAFLDSKGVRDDDFLDIVNLLQEAKLYDGNLNILDLLVLSVKRFVGRIASAEVSVSIDPHTGAPSFGGKIELDGKENVADVSVKISSMLSYIDQLIEKTNMRLWILIDRLDVAFEDNPELERNALRALLRVYSDFRALNKLKLKIFLRHDIFERITKGGFREATHIKKSKELSWGKDDIVHIIARRAAANPELCEYYNTSEKRLISSLSDQQKLISTMIGDDTGDEEDFDKTKFGQILVKLSDGKGEYCPRDVIELFTQMRAIQVEFLEKGGDPPETDCLFSDEVIEAAYQRVSKEKIERVLFAEYPTERELVVELIGTSTTFTPKELSELWNIPSEDTKKAIENLRKIGFFNYGKNKNGDDISIANVYKPGISMKIL